MDEEQALGRRFQVVDRSQAQLHPVVVEQLIAEDHPARAIWEFVGRLDLSRYVEPVKSVEGGAGRPALDPQLLISLWIYSYSRAVSSARAIERLCEYDPAYQWLTGLESISAHTLSDFRVGHAAALHELFVQVLGLLSAEGLITLERVMQDGTRIRASASPNRFFRKDRVEVHFREARRAVEELEAQQEEETTLRMKRARERGLRKRCKRLEAALQQFDKLQAASSRVDRVSTTDPEARIMRQAEGGSAPAYNVQVSTDAASGMIVGIEATQAGSDYRELLPAMDRVEEKLGRAPGQAVVDGGYVSGENITAMAERGIELIGPERKIAAQNARKSQEWRGVSCEYESSRFRYDAASDSFVCPQGKILGYDAKYPSAGAMHYRYRAEAQECAACPAKRFCCPRSKHARSVERIEPQPALAEFRKRMETDEAREIYKTRSQVAEFPNLWIKTKLGVRQFKVRGLEKVTLECLWAALTYDIQQWIRLRWREQVVPATA